jgi:hypothetical protein
MSAGAPKWNIKYSATAFCVSYTPTPCALEVVDAAPTSGAAAAAGAAFERRYDKYTIKPPTAAEESEVRRSWKRLSITVV